MVCAAAVLLAIAVPALGVDQKRMITNVDYIGQCVYCHSDGDMQMYACDKSYNDQEFHLQQIPASDVGDRTNGYLIRSADSGLCLATTWTADVFGWSDCSTSDQGGNGDRSWLLTEQGDGLRIESARYPGFCVATNDGRALFRWRCGDKGQTWTFDPPFILPPAPPAPPAPPPVPPPGAITSSWSGKCLDLPGGDTTDGNLLWTWECNGGASQAWAWNDMAIQWDGGLVWTHCLDVPGGDLTNGNGIEIWECNGLPQQQWGYDESNGSIYLSSSSDASKCLDLQNGGVSDGTPVQLWDCMAPATTNQQWGLASGKAQVV